MKQKPSDQELHERFCPVKHLKSALFVFATFALTTFLNSRALARERERDDVVELVFAMILVAILIRSLLVFTCLRERLLLLIIIISVTAGNIESFVPSVFGDHAGLLKYAHLALSVLGLVISFTMLVQSCLNRPSGTGFEIPN